MIYLIRILTAIALLASLDGAFFYEVALAQDNAPSSTAESGQHANDASVGDGIAAYSLQQYDRAFAIWRPLAEDGEPEAQYRLGVSYDLGLGVEQSSVEALHWFEAAGDAGYGEASFAAANIYAGGQGIGADAYIAFEWYLIAAEQGHARAQYQVASIFLLGELAPKDEVRAAFWFGMAAGNLAAGPEQQQARSAYEIMFARLSSNDQLGVLKELAEQGIDN